MYFAYEVGEVTDLRIGQIGHDLGPRAIGAARNSFL